MSRKIKIITHGQEWIDPAPVILCPECGCEHLSTDISHHLLPEIIGITFVRVSEVKQCKTCGCEFEVDSWHQFHSIDWADLFIWLFIINVVALIFFAICLSKSEPPIWAMVGAGITGCGSIISTLCFLASI